MKADKYQHITDTELLDRYYGEHDNQWLGILLERYTLLLLGVCMKYLKNEEEARDSVQQIFLKAITELAKYKVEFFKSWIYMVAKNHCLMKLRDRQGKMPAELSDKHAVTAAEETNYQDLLQNDHTLDLLEESLKELNPEQQQCVTLFYLQKKNMLLTDLKNIRRLHEILQTQKELLQQDISLTSENFAANESLAKDKVISPLDYRNEKSKLIAKQLSLPQINTSLVSNEAAENDKKKEIADLENQIITQKNNFIQALQTFISEVDAWEYKYLLKAPVSGRVSLAGFYQENQEVKTGQPVFYVQPDNSSYFVEMMVPQYNFGKVKEGQQVLLKFQAYPYEQFGSVTGKIEYISSTPTDSGFLAKVILPDGLRTNYKRELHYQNGLYAEADIVTEDMRLLQRFYYNMVKQIKR
ncbi:MAG: sigma-70 family RNA polymerase sigma factor [Bacteroidetes bacterium]|nr:sigma-70 family RNA polymerase sigma factor [Bacteroidota bacterium]